MSPPTTRSRCELGSHTALSRCSDDRADGSRCTEEVHGVVHTVGVSQRAHASEPRASDEVGAAGSGSDSEGGR